MAHPAFFLPTSARRCRQRKSTIAKGYYAKKILQGGIDIRKFVRLSSQDLLSPKEKEQVAAAKKQAAHFNVITDNIVSSAVFEGCILAPACLYG